MTRYVSLATDANPDYAAYAPIVIRLWRHLGYEPLLVVHDAPQRWADPFGQLVLAELAAANVHMTQVPTVAPLSIANTMRVSRLTAAAQSFLQPDDLILTADVDMAPLSRNFFDRSHHVFSLRTDMYGPVASTNGRVYDGTENGALALHYNSFRFPLCYIGATAKIWRELFPLVADDQTLSLRRLTHGLMTDSTDFDEMMTTSRLLLSRYAVGKLHQLASQTWQQGEIEFHEMTDWPGGKPLRMLIHGEASPTQPFEPDAIDFHMPRPSAPWLAEALIRFWPEETAFLRRYWADVAKLIPLYG